MRHFLPAGSLFKTHSCVEALYHRIKTEKFICNSEFISRNLTFFLRIVRYKVTIASQHLILEQNLNCVHFYSVVETRTIVRYKLWSM